MAGAAFDVAKALAGVRAKITAATRQLNLPREPRLVAVSKTKPVSMIQAAYAADHRHFGENYVQELVSKAPHLPNDIQWHFIGHLQSNKSKQLVGGVPNLWCVEGVDSQKLATALDNACAAVGRPSKLKVFVQVNTSGEASKFGCDPSECTALMKFIIDSCKSLELAGLMTIGKLDAEPSAEWFKRLAACREAAATELKLEPQTLELSMGMSGDFELAMQHGSTNVRVGSSIFGHRDYSKEPASALLDGPATASGTAKEEGKAS